MVTALVSALCNVPVRHDVAMTGEITLRGRVLPIGGLREKALAAHRAGVTSIIIPEENEKDIEDVPAVTRKAVTFIPVRHADKVLENSLIHGGQLWKGLVSREMDEAANPPLSPRQPAPSA